jgi:hypothetical protein
MKKMNTSLTDKYVMLAGLDEVSRWIKNGLAETTQPPAPGADKDDILAGLDGAIDSLVRSGDIKLKNLPQSELERIAKDNNVSIVPTANMPVSEREQYYLQVLKKDKPRGRQASIVLNANGEAIQLKLGRAKIIDNNKCYVFNYSTAVNGKIFSTTTQDNLDKLKIMWGFNHEKAYVTLLYEPGNRAKYTLQGNDYVIQRVGEAPRYTFIVTGKRNGKDYAFVRKETGSAAAGQTRIYGPLGNISATSIAYIPDPNAATGPYGRSEAQKLALLAEIGLT